ncbi:hypothetical protein J6O48_07330 [bacterium]|nr:hypothetical protein [bacterium]
MTREKATNIANLVYKIEETERFIDKFNMLFNETDNQEHIKCLNDAKKHLITYKEQLEQELFNKY